MPAADQFTKANVGQNSPRQRHKLQCHTLEAGKRNVDEEDKNASKIAGRDLHSRTESEEDNSGKVPSLVNKFEQMGKGQGRDGVTPKIPDDDDTEKKEQRASWNESDMNCSETRKNEEDTADNEEPDPAENEHNAGYKIEKQAIEIPNENPATGGRDEKARTSQAGRETGGRGGVSPKMADDGETDEKEQSASVRESGMNNLETRETEGDNVDNEESRPAESERSAGDKLERQVAEVPNEEPAAGGRDEKGGTSQEEDRPDEIKHILAGITDLQLHRVTKKHQKRLEWAIKDIVENISEALSSGGPMAELRLEEIGKLTRDNRSLDAAQQLLKSVLDEDIWECRRFWNVLSQKKVNSQFLMPLLTQDVEEDLILQHRYNLRRQSMKLNFPNPRLISDLYTDPRITVTQHDASGESKSYVLEVEIHEVLKRNNSDSDETTIRVVYGAAGTGKTTLIQKIIYDWALGMKYEEFRFVFHFKIQNLNAIKGRITLRALILEAYPYFENYLDYLCKDPKSLLFIFDDLDRFYRSLIFSENERHLDPPYKCSGTESVCFVSDFLRCLLHGGFLRGCSVLITTRLGNQEILRHLAIDWKFQAIGFTSEKVKEYFCRHLGHGKYTTEIIQLIEQSDILRNMCSNPLFCVTLASSLESHQPQREGQTTMPVINHTQVLLDYVTVLLQICGYDRNTTHNCLREVGELAYKGISRNTLSFEADALKALNTCPANFTTVFMFQDPDKQSTGVVYEFRHYVIRDFLAALTHILNDPIPRLKGLLDETFTDTHGRFRTCSLFLVGLSSRKSTNLLKLELDSSCSGITSCVSEWFMESVKRRLTNMDWKNIQSTFLHILYCLLEFGDIQILTELLASFRTIKFNQLILKPLDCTVLSQTLIYSEVIEELDLSSCLAEIEEIQKLEPVLQRCVVLRLNQNNLQDSGVKHLVNILKKSDCKINILDLNSNHLTDDCLDILFSAISTNSSLTEVNLSNSSQERKHANQFTHEKMQHLIESCSQQTEIRWL